MAVNLTAVYVLTQAVLPGMIERKGGTIVTVGSLAALKAGLIGGVVYGAAKAGVRNLMQHVHNTLRNQGIRATIIMPAEVDTPILDKRWNAVDAFALTPKTLGMGGAILAEAGKPADALAYLERAVRGYCTLAPDDPETLGAMSSLASRFSELQMHDKSVALLRALRKTAADVTAVYVAIRNQINDEAGAATMTHMMPRPTVAVSTSGYLVSRTATWCHRPALAAWA